MAPATATRTQRRLVLLLVPVLVLLAAVRGSGAGAEGEATGTPVAPAEAVLQRASAQLAATESVRFSLDVEGESYIDDGDTIRLIEADGELLRPDRVHATFKVEVVVATVSIELITVGDQSWTTNIITGDWEEAPPEFSYSPVILFDNQQGIGPVMGRVSEAELLEDEEVGDRDAFHVRATVDQEIIGPLTADTLTGTPVTVDLWIDKETDDLLRARLAEPESAGDDPATWTLELMDHGAKVEIEPPI